MKKELRRLYKIRKKIWLLEMGDSLIDDTTMYGKIERYIREHKIKKLYKKMIERKI